MEHINLVGTYGGLTDTRVKEEYDGLYNELIKYWKSNKNLVKELVDRAVNLRAAKESYAIQKKAATSIKKAAALSKRQSFKFGTVDCDPNVREVYFVEGESAGGTAKVARMNNPRFQEIVPFKGKPPNSYKIAIAKLLQNTEIVNALAQIGYDPSFEDPVNHLRVDKIILLSDPDPDGLHINSLMLSAFAVLMPDIFTKNMIYVVKSPKYMVNDNGVQYFGYTIEELRAKLPKSCKKDISYVKGWGEVNAVQLRPVAFDPATRKLIKITSPKQRYFKQLSELMGDNAQARKELLGV
jgi:DNA gyrase/topoisomerase IV subunit B